MLQLMLQRPAKASHCGLEGSEKKRHLRHLAPGCLSLGTDSSSFAGFMLVVEPEGPESAFVGFAERM